MNRLRFLCVRTNSNVSPKGGTLKVLCATINVIEKSSEGKKKGSIGIFQNRSWEHFSCWENSRGAIFEKANNLNNQMSPYSQMGFQMNQFSAEIKSLPSD